METSSIIFELKKTIFETKAERVGERRVCASKLSAILVVVDLYATETNNGYYLGRISK